MEESMIFQAIFKAILIYFMFLFVRGIYRGYKSISVIKEGLGDMGNQSHNPYNSSREDFSTAKKHKQSSDIVDVDYKVVRED